MPARSTKGIRDSHQSAPQYCIRRRPWNPLFHPHFSEVELRRREVAGASRRASSGGSMATSRVRRQSSAAAITGGHMRLSPIRG